MRVFLGQQTDLDTILSAIKAQGYHLNQVHKVRTAGAYTFSVERDADTRALELYRWQDGRGELVAHLAHS